MFTETPCWLEPRLHGQTPRGSSGGPPHVTHGERKVIVILTNPTLIDRISTDSRRIEILQDYIATVSTHKIVATGARHSSFCKKNWPI